MHFHKTIPKLLIIAGWLMTTAVYAAQYTYGDLNRLIQVAYDSGQIVNYSYDAGGNMIMVENVPLYDIGGKILDKQGEQIVDVIVQIGAKTTMTDVNGEWKITNVAEGNYTVYAGKYGYVFAQQELNAEGNNSTAIEVDIDVLRKVKQGILSAGHDYTCALKPDNTVACWGNNSSSKATPPKGTFSQISAGTAHTCGTKTNGAIACWGWDGGQYGLSTAPPGTFSQVSGAKWGHACGVKMDGIIVCWGYPVTSPYPEDILFQVSVGIFYTCGVKIDGIVICWGQNDKGQATPPKDIFTQISAGYSHACGVKVDGTVTCWGNNEKDQATPPKDIFIQISAGSHHTCGIKTDRTVACWGNNEKGQATPPEGMFSQVSTGGAHTCGIKTDGTVVCWGNNEYGQSTPPQDLIVLLVDTDNDGVSDTEDAFPNDPNESVDTDDDGIGNNADTDDDGDGLPDDYENQYAFLNPLDSSDAAADEDGDGKTNLEEYQQGTAPDVSDNVPVHLELTAPDILTVEDWAKTSQISHNIDDTYTYQITTPPEHGNATVSETGLVTYKRTEANYLGKDSLTVTATNSVGLTGTVIIAVNIEKNIQRCLFGTGECSSIIPEYKPLPIILIDADNDGLPDYYEKQYTFLNPLDPSDAAADEDGDGKTNLEEYQQGTDPESNDTPVGIPTLTVTKTGEGRGTITANIKGEDITIRCKSDCEEASYDYQPNNEVIINAYREKGFEFTGWTGDCSGTKSRLTVTMTSDMSCTAQFEPSTEMKKLTVQTVGNGTVTSRFLECGEQCEAYYLSGKKASLKAIPDTGYSFVKWNDACGGTKPTKPTARITMTTDMTCIAEFAPSVELTLMVVGDGTLTNNPSGTDCGTNCDAYPSDATIKLNAKPNVGSLFKNWSGDCDSVKKSTTVVMEAAKTCIANFIVAQANDLEKAVQKMVSQFYESYPDTTHYPDLTEAFQLVLPVLMILDEQYPKWPTEFVEEGYISGEYTDSIHIMPDAYVEIRFKEETMRPIRIYYEEQPGSNHDEFISFSRWHFSPW